MKNNLVIAIDGPSGVGKSTIANQLSKRLNIAYIDTGAMYRAIAYGIETDKINAENDQELEKFLNSISLTYVKGSLVYNGEKIEPHIRTEKISSLSSKLSQKSIIRKYLVKRQRELAKEQSIVMEGRDIGTVVLPDASIKFYLTANEEIRAKRRLKQLREKGDKTSVFMEIYEDLKVRDYQDMNRENSPLLAAKDAIVIDNTLLTLEETVEMMLKIIEKNNEII